MASTKDMELLREYAAHRSEAAFTELVSRQVNYVYSAALRQVRDPHLAVEITQAVFIILAQKAGRISENTILTGWLFKTTRFVALAEMRNAANRRRREHEAHMQSESEPTKTDPIWEQMSPLLDEALAALGEMDRQAILLRFFENKSLMQVGAELGTGEDTARKRVSRALEKLHRYFSRRGVPVPAAIIAGALSAHSVHAAPAALVKTVSVVAAAKGATASASTLTLIKGALKIMAWTKAKIVAATAIVAIAGISVTTMAVKHGIHSQPVPGSYPGDWIWEPDSQTLEKVPPLLLLQPTRLPGNAVPFEMFGKGRYLARGRTLKELIGSIYAQKDSRLKITFPDDLSGDKFDCIVTLPGNWWDTLESEIDKRFNLVTVPDYKAGRVVVKKSN